MERSVAERLISEFIFIAAPNFFSAADPQNRDREIGELLNRTSSLVPRSGKMKKTSFVTV
jgi:hypothetical protein